MEALGMNGMYNIGDVVLGNWTLSQLVGEGSYGRVFEARREDFGMSYIAAIKIITIPKNDAEIVSVRAEGMDEESLTGYFRSIVEEIVREFALMSKLKGTANVVSYEDHTVVPHFNGIGWDIIIRMELLTPLLVHANNSNYTRQTIIKLGIDICRALERHKTGEHFCFR
jgi:serine/threonine protein kinase